MAVPTYDKFIEPILRYLAANPDGARARDAHEAAANALAYQNSTDNNFYQVAYSRCTKIELAGRTTDSSERVCPAVPAGATGGSLSKAVRLRIPTRRRCPQRT